LAERRKAKLIGAAKLVSEADGIGVAMFDAENALLVSKMDGDFNVVDFVEFYNEQGFEITYDLPAQYRGREITLGDPAPVPFWNKGNCVFIDGDAEKTYIEQLFGSQADTDPVLRDLGRMLDDARNGRIKQKLGEWEAADIASGFDDVFLEPPSRTRYWVARYRAALQNARKLTTPPHPIDVRLRKAASGWLRKFATKAEPAMLGGILGNSGQGIFSSKQIRDILFAYVVHKVAVNSRNDLDVILREDTAVTVFASGLYRYFIDNGWPHVPFKYHRIDLLELVKVVINHGARRRNFEAAAKLSKLMFGKEDAPNMIVDHVMLFIPDAVRAYRNALKEGQKSYHGYRYREDATSDARRIVGCYKQVEYLSMVISGADRTQGRMMDRRYGMSSDEIEDWILLAARDKDDE
jgi:hypothetical protein